MRHTGRVMVKETFPASSMTPAATLLQHPHYAIVQGTRTLAQRPLFRRLLTLGLGALLAAGTLNTPVEAAPSWAPDVPAGPALRVNIGSGQADLPVVSLGTWMSQAGEAKEDFLMRAGSVLQAFAAGSGYEACGTVWQKDGRSWAVPLTTNIAHAGCVATNLRLQEAGWSMTVDTIHVHPQQSSYSVNSADRLLLGMPLSRGAARTAIGHSEGDGFSNQDFLAGPGYVVAGGRLMHQHGRTTVRDLGEVPVLELSGGWKPVEVLQAETSEPSPPGRRLALR